MQELGLLPSADFSAARDVSSDGSVIVGTSGNQSPPLPRTNQAFRWTRDEGLVGLGMLPGDQTSSAGAVSADGSIVLGQSRLSSTEFTTFVWDDMKGMRSVRDFLTNELGLSDSIEGWTRISVHDLSADNSTYVGSGVNPDGNREAWRVVIPEPSTLALALMAVIGFGALVRQRLPFPT